MADEVKTKMSEELDEELDSIIDKMIEKNKDYKYSEGLTEENWEEEIEKIPFFMSKPLEDGEEVSAELAALQALKYEDEDPTARATAYKEEGNYEYKQKNFRKAILAYTEGIKTKSEDKNLNAVLYTNRATVNFTIGNNRSALKDAIMAHKCDPQYIKAIVRGASTCFNLKIFDHSILWCDKGLKIEPENEKLLNLRRDAVVEQKKAERDKRKAQLKKKKKIEELDALLEAIKVYFEDQESGKLCHVESSCPLKKVLSDKRFIVRQGTPAFVILVKKSSFKKEFLKHCTVERF